MLVSDDAVRIGRISRLVSPLSGQCYRCHTTWMFVRWHLTRYSENGACFPLCVKCWKGLSAAERVPFYLDMLGEWTMQGADVTVEQREQIVNAVLAGK